MNQYLQKNIFFKIILFLLVVYFLESILEGIGLLLTSIIWNLDAAFLEDTNKEISKINYNIIPDIFGLVATVSVISFFQVKIDNEKINSTKTLFGKFNLVHFVLAIFLAIIILLASVLSVGYDAGFWNELTDYYQNYFIGIFIISLLAAVPEELIFRGYILGEFKKKYSWKFATLLMAILFTLIHIPFSELNLSRLLLIFMSGIFYGVYVSHYKNIWATIAFHFSWNFFDKAVFFINEDINNLHSNNSLNSLFLFGALYFGIGIILMTVIKNQQIKAVFNARFSG